MTRVEGIRETDGVNSVFDLQVSTVEELPHIGDAIGSHKVAAGTISQCIQDGKWYTLDDDGSWYDEDGNEPEDS